LETDTESQNLYSTCTNQTGILVFMNSRKKTIYKPNHPGKKKKKRPERATNARKQRKERPEQANDKTEKKGAPVSTGYQVPSHCFETTDQHANDKQTADLLSI